MQEASIFIFRRDLRIHDNTAFNKLLGVGSIKIIPLFIFNPDQIYADKNPYFSNNAVQFMIESLKDLEKHIHINYFEGKDINILETLRKKYKILNVAFNKDYTPFAIKRDTAIAEWCKEHDINLITAEDYTLFPLGTITNKSKKPYQIFTPFYKATLQHTPPKPVTVKQQPKIIKVIHQFNKDRYYQNNLDIAVHGGRANGLERLKKAMKNYSKERDYPALDSTTKLSAYIKFGCLSIREVFHHYAKQNVKALTREFIWREFYANIMYYFPHILGRSFKKKYDHHIKWTNDKEWFQKWKEGNTGFALVDAGMKQLNATGWMHNRVRMIVAMFLTKDLLIDWRWGEKYFATKLVDYDPASNNGGWQWSSSTGTDAQPYFRIFNPDLQIKKYDKNYEYIKRWNPNYTNKKKIIDHSERAKIAIRAFKAAANNSG
jgi:deoxyribodipyrimidine photo-lyase